MLASFPAVLWFFRFRKIMITRQSSIVRVLEEAFRPRDTRYWLVGYLVGFRGKYWIKREVLGRAWVLYLSPPHHIFFYIPAIILFKKKERLEVTVELTRQLKLDGEAHIIDENFKPSLKSLEIDVSSRGGLSRFSVQDYRASRGFYRIYYRGEPEVVDLAKRMLASIGDSIRVTRLSVVPKMPAIHATFVTEGASIEAIREGINSLLASINSEAKALSLDATAAKGANREEGGVGDF